MGLTIGKLQEIYDMLKPVAAQNMADGVCKLEEKELILRTGIDFFLTDADLAKRQGPPVGFTMNGVWYADPAVLKKMYGMAVALDAKDGSFDGHIGLDPSSDLESAGVSNGGGGIDFKKSIFAIRTETAKGQGEGTIWVIDKENIGNGKFRYWMITNAHVADNLAMEETRYVLKDHSGNEFDIKLKGLDHTYDTAVFFLDASADFQPLATVENANVSVGEELIIVGNQNGNGIITVTGRVNSTEKYMNFSMPLIQDDSQTFPGNSGSPVFNASGGVVAVCNYGRNGESYNIPIQNVLDSYKQIRGKGFASHGVAHQFSVSFWGSTDLATRGIAGIKSALFVTHVMDPSDVYEHGLRVGDVILSYDGLPIPDSSELAKILSHIANKKGGDLKFGVLRGKERLTIRTPIKTYTNGKLPTYETPFGFLLCEMSDDAKVERLQAVRKGLVIVGRQENTSSASIKGTLFKIDDTPINSIDEFKKYIETSSKRSEFMLYISTGTADNPIIETNRVHNPFYKE